MHWPRVKRSLACWHNLVLLPFVLWPRHLPPARLRRQLCSLRSRHRHTAFQLEILAVPSQSSPGAIYLLRSAGVYLRRLPSHPCRFLRPQRLRPHRCIHIVCRVYTRSPPARVLSFHPPLVWDGTCCAFAKLCRFAVVFRVLNGLSRPCFALRAAHLLWLFVRRLLPISARVSLPPGVCRTSLPRCLVAALHLSSLRVELEQSNSTLLLARYFLLWHLAFIRSVLLEHFFAPSPVPLFRSRSCLRLASLSPSALLVRSIRLQCWRRATWHCLRAWPLASQRCGLYARHLTLRSLLAGIVPHSRLC